MRLEAKLKQQGVDAYYFLHEEGLYKVRFGNHTEYAAARTEAERLQDMAVIGNFFIVIPQIVNGVFGGPLIKRVFESHAIYALVIAGISLIIAAISVRFVDDKDEVVAG